MSPSKQRNTDSHLVASFPGQPGLAGTRKIKPFLHFNEARDDGVTLVSAGPYTLLQTDNHASTLSVILFTSQMLFLTPNQQC